MWFIRPSSRPSVPKILSPAFLRWWSSRLDPQYLCWLWAQCPWALCSLQKTFSFPSCLWLPPTAPGTNTLDSSSELSIKHFWGRQSVAIKIFWVWLTLWFLRYYRQHLKQFLKVSVLQKMVQKPFVGVTIWCVKHQCQVSGPWWKVIRANIGATSRWLLRRFNTTWFQHY